MSNRYIYVLQHLLLGAVTGIGFLFPVLWWVSLGAIGWWLYLLRRVDTVCTAWLVGMVFGTSKMLVVLSYFFAPYPIDWLGLAPGVSQLFLISLYWIPAAIVLGLSSGLFAFVYYKLHSAKIPTLYLIGVIPLVWVVSETLASVIFSIIFLGQGSTINSNFSFGYVGYLMVDHGLLSESARLAGVYSLSFLGIGFLYVMSISPSYKFVVSGISIFFITALISFPTTSTPQDISVTAIETPYTSEPLRTINQQNDLELEKFSIVQAALQQNTNYIILPEDFRFTSYFDNPEDVFTFITNSTDQPVILVDSGRVEDPLYGTVLRAYIYDSAHQKIHTFDKQYLVPQGEYVPFVYTQLIRALKLSPETTTALKNTSYVPGLPQQKVSIDDSIPAILFCFESVDPKGTQVIINRSVPFVAHIVSHAWFKNYSYLLQNQLDTMLRVQAVYSQKNIIQAANSGDVKMYTPTEGVVVADSIIQTESAILHTFRF